MLLLIYIVFGLFYGGEAAIFFRWIKSAKDFLRFTIVNAHEVSDFFFGFRNKLLQGSYEAPQMLMFIYSMIAGIISEPSRTGGYLSLFSTNQDLASLLSSLNLADTVLTPVEV